MAEFERRQKKKQKQVESIKKEIRLDAKLHKEKVASHFEKVRQQRSHLMHEYNDKLERNRRSLETEVKEKPLFGTKNMTASASLQTLDSPYLMRQSEQEISIDQEIEDKLRANEERVLSA